jgi:type II secretory pathway component PulM
MTTALSLPTGRRGQLLALGLTGLMAAVLWFVIASPLLQAYADRTEALHRQEQMARRMEDLVRTLPALREQATTAAKAGRESAALLPGTSDALAAATLQQKLDELAKASSVQIGSEEIIPAQASGGFRAIGVRIALHAPYRMLIALMQALAQADIPMVVSDLSIRAPSADTHDPDASVDAGLTVSALRTASGQTAGEAAPGTQVQRTPDQP